MNKDMVFAYKVIFGLSMLFGGTFAWGLKEHNEKKRQVKYARELKDIYDVEGKMLEGCIKVLGNIADKAVMNSSPKVEEEDDADKSK